MQPAEPGTLLILKKEHKQFAVFFFFSGTGSRSPQCPITSASPSRLACCALCRQEHQFACKGLRAIEHVLLMRLNAVVLRQSSLNLFQNFYKQHFHVCVNPRVSCSLLLFVVVFVRETAYWRNDSSVEINKSKASKAENANNCLVERQTALVKRIIKFSFYFLSNSKLYSNSCYKWCLKLCY